MRKSLLAPAAAFAAVLAGVGSIAVGTHPAAAATEMVNVHIVATSPGSSPRSMILTGSMTAAGTYVPKGTTGGTAMLPGGRMSVVSKVIKKQQSFDPATCLLSINVTSSYVLSKGTGKYANISGSGTSHTQILGVAERLSTGQCSMSTFAAYQEITTGKGPVSG